VFLEGTVIRVRLVVTFAVKAFEHMGAWVALLGLKSRRIDLVVSFATPSKMPVMIS